VEEAVALWLVSPEARPWLERALAEPDPGSLAAADRFRRELPGSHAAAVLAQAALRRRARGKLGEQAGSLFLTRDGLEMATRPAVARWRAARLAAAGVERVTDAGCGLGLDSLALAAAGLSVRAVDRDPVTAILAAANLAGFPNAEVRRGEAAGVMAAWAAGGEASAAGPDALAAWAGPGARPGGAALFLDPSRRTGTGRTWDIADLSPAWTAIEPLLSGPGPVVVKLGPGLPHRHIPPGVDATWVSDGGDLAELSLWHLPGETGRWSALLLPEGDEIAGHTAAPAPGPLGRFVWEPGPAVIRAHAVGTLARQLNAHLVAPSIAYLTGDHDVTTPFATRFEVRQVLPYEDKAVKAWVRTEQIGTLEIKTRGLDLDPAKWRTRLAPKGKNSATIIATPTREGASVLVVTRT
jgi:SAM-dependent methyltransferase